MQRAVQAVDPAATVRDNHDMSCQVFTGMRYEIELADAYRCLPRPAGVRMIVVDRGPVRL